MPVVKSASAFQHLELTKKGFAALLNSAVDGIVITDKEGLILNFNRSAERLFGYSFEDIQNKNVNILMTSLHHTAHNSYMKNYHATGERKIIGIGRRVEARKQDGTIFPIHLSIGEYVEGDGRYYIGTIKDLTSQVETERLAKEFRDRLAHVDRINIMGEMASGIAHELNQPLTAISSYVHAVQRRINQPEIDLAKIKDLLTKVEAQTIRAGKVIDRVRSLSKAEDIVRDRVRVNNVVIEAIELIKSDATGRGVNLQTKYSPENPEVFIDTVQIQQVVLNIVRNAIDATEERGIKQGKIYLMTLTDNENVAIVVEDEAGGISEEIRDKLFHPFVTSKVKGIGLGLSISRSIVDAHGGTLVAEDIEQGTIFRFTIPIAVGSSD